MPFWIVRSLNLSYSASSALLLLIHSLSVSAVLHPSESLRSSSPEPPLFEEPPLLDSWLCSGRLGVGQPKKPITTPFPTMAERDGCVSDWGSYISPSATEFAAPLKGCGLFRVGLLKKRVVIVNYSEYMKKAVESRTERDLRYCKLEAGVFFDCSSPTMPADSGFNHELLSPSPNSREVRRIRLYNNLFLMKSNRFGLFHEPGQKDPVLISIPENQGMYDLFCLPLDSIVPPPKLGAIRTHLNGFQSWASRLFA